MIFVDIGQQLKHYIFCVCAEFGYLYIRNTADTQKPMQKLAIYGKEWTNDESDFSFT